MSAPAPRKTLKECIRNFTWAWYTVNMGTGIVTSLAAQYHFGRGGVGWEAISLIFFFINLSLWLIFNVCTIARYWMYPGIFWKMLNHPVQSLFTGAFAMGSATVINGALVSNQQYNFGGKGFLYALWGFWWADMAVCLVTAFWVTHRMITTQTHALERLAPAWILPSVSLVVASSTGGYLSEALLKHSTHHALITSSIALMGLLIGLTISGTIISFYLLRLIIHGLPDKNLILSGFIALGPSGQGGVSFLVNGRAMSQLLPIHFGDNFPNSPLTGQMIYAICFSAGWVCWAMALTWVIIAIACLYAVTQKEKLPFSLGTWGVIFPNGVFALLTVQLGVALDSPFFHYLGAILSAAVFLLWIYAVVMTIPIVLNTTIFFDPCLATPGKETRGKSPVPATKSGETSITTA